MMARTTGTNPNQAKCRPGLARTKSQLEELGTSKPEALIGFENVNVSVFYTIIVYLVIAYKSFEKFVFSIFYSPLKRLIVYNLGKCDIKINGPRPSDMQVKPENEKEFFIRLGNSGPLALGEMYMEGLWTCDDLDTLLQKVLDRNVHKIYFNAARLNTVLNHLMFFVCNLQTKERAWEVGQRHYDKGNDLFEAFLDPTMNYSCGYWRNADNLNQAQLDKMELIAQKLKLKPGMRVLDIGCGWGALCKYLAEKHEVQVVGCTISKEQAELARQNCQGLPVTIELVDYRDINEKFDRIVSVGMFEHVGVANYRTFFEVSNKCLPRDGLLLLHTIGTNHPSVPRTEPWFHKYIFPNGVLPYHTDITKYSDGLFIIEDWHNFGNDYSKTLIAWKQNFVKAWPKLEGKYGEVFYRMWYYYLTVSTAAFKSRKYQLWQVTFSKGLTGGYQSVR